MVSKLINLANHEAQNLLEVSLRDAYDHLHPRLRPPLKLIVPTPPEYLDLNRAILYGVLCEPLAAKALIKYLHAVVNDGYSFFVKLLSQVIDELYSKMMKSAKVQLIWVSSIMVDVAGLGFDNLLVSLLRQIIGGDFSDENLWLAHEMVNLFTSKWNLILNEEPIVLTFGLYTYLRLLADHYRLPHGPKLLELKRKEIGFCMRMLREHFHLCLKIGRDLVRLLQDLIHIPEFRAVWKDLVSKPSAFQTLGFSDLSQVYDVGTSNRYHLLRITPEMETQLRFLLTHVKLGSQRRHQVWFARKFLFVPDRETLICDIVRFICCAYHPSNEIIESDVIPRWAVVGWLLMSCTKRYTDANVKLALFYDWMFFNEKVDNFMNIEPAMLLMINSVPRYIGMTNSLLEFLLLLVDNYDIQRKDIIFQGVSSAISTLVRKGVIYSLDVLTSSEFVSPLLKEMLKKFMLRMRYEIPKEPHPAQFAPLSVASLSLLNPCSRESKRPLPGGFPAFAGNVGVGNSAITAFSSVDSLASFDFSGVNCESQVDVMGNLVGKLGEFMRNSSKIGLKYLEKFLHLYVNLDRLEKSGDVSPKILACKIEQELDLAGYKLFSPFQNLQVTLDTDDEVQSATATIIRTFFISQHYGIKEMLLFWSRNTTTVGARLLSYAVRLAYEAHIAGFGENSLANISYDQMMPFLKHHIGAYFGVISRNGGGQAESGTVFPASEVDKKLISNLIDSAFCSYRSVLTYSRENANKESMMSLGKFLSADVVSCSLWKREILAFLFHCIFTYLSDVSVGEEGIIRVLVSQMKYADLVDIQIQMGLKRFRVFGRDVLNVLQIIRRSINWEPIEQHNLWGLIRSELSVSEFPVEKLLLDFFSTDLDINASSIAIGGLLSLCCCCTPSPEFVGAIFLLPSTKFPDFSASVLSNWIASNASVLINSIADFLDKLERNNRDISGITINESAVLFLLSYIKAHGPADITLLDKLSLNLSNMKVKLGHLTVASEAGYLLESYGSWNPHDADREISYS